MVLPLGVLHMENNRRIHEEVLLRLVILFDLEGQAVDTFLFRTVKHDPSIRVGLVGSDLRPGIIFLLLKRNRNAHGR